VNRYPASIKFASLAVVLAGLGLAALYFFEPGGSAIYPVCLLYTKTSILCPGCGSLRAAHHLLHGNLAIAFQFNPLFVTLLPAALGWAALSMLRGRAWNPFASHPVLAWSAVVVVVLFGILRNLPFGFANALRW
jgi:hypothetical protein